MLKKCFVGLLLFSLFLVSGCDLLKGPKGDPGSNGTNGTNGATGPSGMISTKTYTGKPTSNFYSVSCPEIVDLSKQVVACYSYSTNYPNQMTLLPSTYQLSGDTFEDNVTIFSDTHSVMFTTYENGTAYSGAALLGSNYRIDIKTFTISSALKIYKMSEQNRGSTAEALRSFCLHE